ncbi:MAG: DUF4097 domain-containing protein [Proteobacteria bacterium]|nr:DUF4097 domain-containing protein [Pseudomonadota bacterium]
MIDHAKRTFSYLMLMALLCVPYAAKGGPEKKIPAVDLTTVEVQMASGEVQVLAWNSMHVTIEHQSASLPYSTDKGNLKIGKLNPDGSGVKDNLRVFVPEHLHISVITKTGNVDIQGFSSRIQVLTVSGDVKVSSCSAPVEIETVGGRIETWDIKGDVSLKTVSGTIRSRNVKSEFMEIKSVNGAQFFEGVSSRQLRIRSHSGSVEFKGDIPPNGFWEASTFDAPMTFIFDTNPSLDLEVQSRSGQVRVEDAIKPREKAGNYFRGRLGTGATLVRLITFEGDIDVRLDD